MKRTPAFQRLRMATLSSHFRRLAADPETEEGEEDPQSESELVEKVEKTPVEKWRNYLQAIERLLAQEFSTTVTLVGAKPKSGVGSPSDQFIIKGGLKFPEGRPLEIEQKFGKDPVFFEALIVDGEIVEPITFSG